jgi:uncharacterized repeat protein (TIGR03803 family)
MIPQEVPMTRPREKTIFIAVCMTLFGAFAVASALAADTYTILYSFSNTDPDNGKNPHGSLIFDASGNLYGTTFDGGSGTGAASFPGVADGNGASGGTVFELSPNGSGGWTQQVLYSFCSAAKCADGNNPVDRLIFDASGNLYGTADLGGSANAGVVYELKPGQGGTWTESVLYNFCSVSGCTDGEEPWAGLVFDAAGNLYGTTKTGGAYGHGTAFKLSPGGNGNWTESVIYSFCALSGCADGAQVQGSLVFDSKGNLYGTTFAGGPYTNSGCPGVGDTCGTVYKLSPEKNGPWTEHVLHSFNFTDGAGSETGLIFDTKGNLYGTTTRGGSGEGGVVFELSPKASGGWSTTVIDNFGSDGYPLCTLTFDTAGNLYGTVDGHNTKGKGAVFELSPAEGGTWTESVLHSFSGSDGGNPSAGVTLDGSGNVYGTGYGGGPKGAGVVFEITP